VYQPQEAITQPINYLHAAPPKARVQNGHGRLEPQLGLPQVAVNHAQVAQTEAGRGRARVLSPQGCFVYLEENGKRMKRFDALQHKRANKTEMRNETYSDNSFGTYLIGLLQSLSLCTFSDHPWYLLYYDV